MKLYRAYHGFTLVELLAVIAVVAILGAILVPVISSAVKSSQRTESQSVMRNIGQTLSLYIVENSALPGPLYLEQDGRFYGGQGQLTTFLQPYLSPSTSVLPGATEFSLLPGFTTGHWASWYEQAKPALPKPYRLTQTRYWDSETGQNIYPWGYPGSDPNQQQQNTNRFFNALDPAKTEALRDYFAPPKSPAYGELQNYTTRLFFDWHVEIVDEEI